MINRIESQSNWSIFKDNWISIIRNTPVTKNRKINERIIIQSTINRYYPNFNSKKSKALIELNYYMPLRESYFNIII